MGQGTWGHPCTRCLATFVFLVGISECVEFGGEGVREDRMNDLLNPIIVLKRYPASPDYPESRDVLYYQNYQKVLREVKRCANPIGI